MERKIYYGVHKRSLVVPVLSHINPIDSPAPLPHPTSGTLSLMFVSHPHPVFQFVSFPQVSPPMHIFSPPYVPHAQPISFFLIWSTEWYLVRITNHYAVCVTSVVGRVSLVPVCLRVIRFYLVTYHPEGWKFDAWGHCTLQILAPHGDKIRGVRLSLCLVKLRVPDFYRAWLYSILFIFHKL